MRHYAFMLLVLNVLSIGICLSAFASRESYAKSNPLLAKQPKGSTTHQTSTETPELGHTTYSEYTSAPSECEITEAEAHLIAFFPLKKGAKIANHRIKSVEKKVLNDVAYNYGYYEVSGTQNGKPWGPQKMAYLILWKKLSPESWKMYLDIWDYQQNEKQDLYLF